jgi:non-canonical purine NTP pyrophosphatase (RdgB/HAM1 family)
MGLQSEMNMSDSSTDTPASTPCPLLVGTGNAHKAGEIAAMLSGEPPVVFRAVTPGELGVSDDSGIVVDALDGRPGIYSARYAPSDGERVARLLDEMRDVPASERTARFVCAAALVVPAVPGSSAESVEIVELGTCEGLIALEPCGENGFGYDPVFYLLDVECTMAQLAPEAKNARSHRGLAFAAMRPHLIRLCLPNSQ